MKTHYPQTIRWIRESDISRVYEIWHVSKVHSHGRHARMVWTAAAVADEFGYLTSTAAYKDVCELVRDPFVKRGRERCPHVSQGCRPESF